MQKIVASFIFFSFVYALNAMEAGHETAPKPPITVVIRPTKTNKICVTRETLQGQCAGLAVYLGNDTLIMQVKANDQGRYDITHLIEAEHTLTMQDAASLVVEARQEGRKEAMKKMPFVIGNCQKYTRDHSDFIARLLVALEAQSNYRFSENKERYSFCLLPKQGNNGLFYDITMLCDELWDNGYKQGQASTSTRESDSEKTIKELREEIKKT